jgi:hypothetical protein
MGATPEMESLRKELVDITNVFANDAVRQTPVSPACDVIKRFGANGDFQAAIKTITEDIRKKYKNGSQQDVKSNFLAFIDQFLRPEGVALKQSGVNDITMDQILSRGLYMRQEMNLDTSANNVLKAVQDFGEAVCKAASEAKLASEQQRIDAMRAGQIVAIAEGLGGLVLIAVDASAVFETAGTAGYSISAATPFISDALTRLIMSH